MKKIASALSRNGHTIVSKIKRIFRKLYKKVTQIILTYPARSFFTLIGLLFLIIVVGNVLSRISEKAAPSVKTQKEVQIFGIGQAPKIRVNGRTEKTGSVKITSQAGGVVQKVYVKAGDRVKKGTILAWISSNYQGGTLPSVGRQIAQKNYDFVDTNFNLQKEIIGKRRDIANRLKDQAGDLRNITNDSLESTRNLINLNNELLTALDKNLEYLENTNVGGANDALILQTKQGKAGIMTALNSFQSALRNSEYQSSDSKAPAQLASLTNELTNKQLDMEEKALELNREISKLNLTVAKISESFMYPSSPVSGTVERVYVLPGQNIASNTLLVSMVADKTSSNVIVSVPSSVAKNISRLEDSILYINGNTVHAKPVYISSEATEGSLHSILFLLPIEIQSAIPGGTVIAVDLPVGASQAVTTDPYVPIDAVYQSESDSYIFTVESIDGKKIARSQKVTLGTMYGRYVEVLTGIDKESEIINSRNVIDGDEIVIKQ